MGVDFCTEMRDKTLVLLRNRPEWMTFSKIAGETGLAVSWLSAFRNGKIENPGVNFIETLYNYLTTMRVK